MLRHFIGGCFNYGSLYAVEKFKNLTQKPFFISERAAIKKGRRPLPRGLFRWRQFPSSEDGAHWNLGRGEGYAKPVPLCPVSKNIGAALFKVPVNLCLPLFLHACLIFLAGLVGRIMHGTWLSTTQHDADKIRTISQISSRASSPL